MNDKAKSDFIVDLHKRNSDKLGFIPKPYLQKLIENDQVFISSDGGLSSGFCVIGNGNSFNLKIYQHILVLHHFHNLWLYHHLSTYFQGQFCRG